MDTRRFFTFPIMTVFAAMGLALGWEPEAQAQSFLSLGSLWGEGFTSKNLFVSGDGQVVVGTRTTAVGEEAFRWTQAEGIVGLGDLPGGDVWSPGLGVSWDGSVIVGSSVGPQGLEAFRWTSAGGMVGLGSLSSRNFGSLALGVSPDGATVVGESLLDYGQTAFRWTNESGLVGGSLPQLGNDFLPWGTAYSVAADGRVVGYSKSNSAPDVVREAFYWSANGVPIALGDLPGGSFSSGVIDLSLDGSVIVGWGSTAAGLEAFRWTSETGLVGLGDLPGGTFWSGAIGVSADGSVIVGLGNNGQDAAFIWDAESGMRSLQTVLTDYGLDLSGWTLTTARDISGDGTRIVGYGTHNGVTEAFVATIVPEPSTALLLGGAGLGLLLRRRR